MGLNITKLANELLNNNVTVLNVKDVKDKYKSFNSIIISKLETDMHKALEKLDDYDHGIGILSVKVKYWDDNKILIEHTSIAKLYHTDNQISGDRFINIFKHLIVNGYKVIKYENKRLKHKKKKESYFIKFKEGYLNYKNNEYKIEKWLEFGDNFYYKITKTKVKAQKRAITIDAEITVNYIEGEENFKTLIHKLKEEILDIEINRNFKITDCDCYNEYE